MITYMHLYFKFNYKAGATDINLIRITYQLNKSMNSTSSFDVLNKHIFIEIKALGRLHQLEILGQRLVVEFAKSQLAPHDTGHISTAISWMESRVATLTRKLDEIPTNDFENDRPVWRTAGRRNLND